MSSTYSYSKNDFIGLGSPPTTSINLVGLEQQVYSSDISTAGLSYINTDDENVYFTFDQPFGGSPNEKYLLDEIVATHDGTHVLSPTGDTILSYSFADQDGTPLKTINSTFTRSATVVFEGTDFYDAAPVKVEVTAYVEGTAIGEVRLYDLDNDIILGTATINTTSEQVIAVPITGEWSEEQATIELQMKRSSGGEAEYVVISSLQIIF